MGVGIVGTYANGFPQCRQGLFETIAVPQGVAQRIEGLSVTGFQFQRRLETLDGV